MKIVFQMCLPWLPVLVNSLLTQNGPAQPTGVPCKWLTRRTRVWSLSLTLTLTTLSSFAPTPTLLLRKLPPSALLPTSFLSLPSQRPHPHHHRHHLCQLQFWPQLGQQLKPSHSNFWQCLWCVSELMGVLSLLLFMWMELEFCAICCAVFGVALDRCLRQHDTSVENKRKAG